MTSYHENDVLIVGALRTAIGGFLGGLSSLSAPRLGASVIEALLKQTGVDACDIDDVILGHVLQAGCGQNTARQASLYANLPQATPAACINQVCGSGLRAVCMGMQSILCGDSNIVIAGGHENMSLSPHTAYLRRGIKMGSCDLQDSMVIDGLQDVFNNYHMGITAENVAHKLNISRQEQDEFAILSQEKAHQAQVAGRFKDEIVPVSIKERKELVVFDTDEHLKPNTNLESLSKLRPAFQKDGTVTAGNASGLNDGAAALLLTTGATAKERSLQPLARIVSWAHAGVDPAIMGLGPVLAVKKALFKARWKIESLDLIEANEAFASQAIGVNRELNWDTKKVNVNGGAIALGHPIGASGARILVTLLHEMKKRGAQKGLATLCIGGGMGIAICVESL